MPNKTLTFDAATFADAIQKAARVAPRKGAAYDKAAGILISSDDKDFTNDQVIVRATNLDSTYLQRLNPIEAKNVDADFAWRIPSALLAALVSNLNLGSGAQIKLIDTGDGDIRIFSGNVKVRYALLQGVFPTIEEFGIGNMSEAHDFAQKAAQVSWACDKGSGLLSGVHIDGQYLIATDREATALVPCVVPIGEPVTVPLWNISTILKNASDVRLAAAERELRISLDAESQATSRLIEGAYPPIKNALETRDAAGFLGSCKISKSSLVESVNRLLTLGASEDLPRLKLTFGNTGLTKTLTLNLIVPDTGQIQDMIDVGGEFGDPFQILVSPRVLTNAVSNSKDDLVEIHFGTPGHPSPELTPLKVTDSRGYVSLFMPRKEI